MPVQPTPILIRPIEDDDLPCILDVYRQCQYFLVLGLVPHTSLTMVAEDIERSKGEGGVFCGIYALDETLTPALIGVVDYVPLNFDNLADQAFISLLMIAVSQRRRSFGQQALTHIEADIRTIGQVNKILTAVQVHNPDALRFWQRNGYIIISGPTLQPDTTRTYRLEKLFDQCHDNHK